MNVNRVKEIVETWNVEKIHAREFSRRDMRKFIELMNDRTRMLIQACDNHTVDYYQELATLSADAESVTRETSDLVREGIIGPRYYVARTLVQTFQVWEHDFYIGLMELAVHACTIVTPKAKIIADGIDRTNV